MSLMVSGQTSPMDRKKWTKEEDAQLIVAMRHFKNAADVRWTEVSMKIPGRNAKACRKRWVNGLNEDLKKGSWTEEEDACLWQSVRLYGKDWAKVSMRVPHRSGDQCSKRWREVLDPCINKSPWSPEEDKRLADLYAKHGSAWQVISTHFNNRRALQCRNRCCRLLGLNASLSAKPPKKNDIATNQKATPVSGTQQHFSLPTPTWDANTFAMDGNFGDHKKTLSETPYTCTPTPTMDAGIANGSMYGLQMGLGSIPALDTEPIVPNTDLRISLLNTPIPAVQGFSANSRIIPPSPLNLDQANSVYAGQDALFTPLSSSPSLASSLNATPTTPCLADPMMMVGMNGHDLMTPNLDITLSNRCLIGGFDGLGMPEVSNAKQDAMKFDWAMSLDNPLYFEQQNMNW